MLQPVSLHEFLCARVSQETRGTIWAVAMYLLSWFSHVSHLEQFASQPNNPFTLIPVWSVMSLSSGKGKNVWIWNSLLLLTSPANRKFWGEYCHFCCCLWWWRWLSNTHFFTESPSFRQHSGFKVKGGWKVFLFYLVSKNWTCLSMGIPVWVSFKWLS